MDVGIGARTAPERFLGEISTTEDMEGAEGFGTATLFDFLMDLEVAGARRISTSGSSFFFPQWNSVPAGVALFSRSSFSRLFSDLTWPRHPPVRRPSACQGRRRDG